jgi:hypothetical protein
MRELRITLSHRPGELARLADALAEKSVNLKSLAVLSEGNKAVACLVADDVAAARSALEASRIPFEEGELLSELLENEPGRIAELASKLAGAGVNMNSLYILGRDDDLIEIGFTVDDPKKAKKALEGG